MAVNSSDDLSSTTENGRDLMHNGDATETDHVCKLVCVFCGAAAAGTRHLKVLPCLHITCQRCLTQFLSDTSPCHNDADFATSIFSCPRCSYTVQLPSDGVAGLRDAVFLQSSLTSHAARSDVEWSGPSRHLSLTGHPTSCIADIENTSPSQSLPDMNHSEDIQLRYRYPENSTCAVETLHDGAMNSKNRNYSGVCGKGELERLDDTMGVTRSQIRSLSQDAVCRQHDCEEAIEQTKVAARDLDTRKTALRSSICERADHLCRVVRSRCNQLLRELDWEHSQGSAEYGARIDALNAHGRSLEDGGQFAAAVLAAGENVSAELAADVAARLNQLVLSEPREAGARGDVTVMRLDVPDAQHEESHVMRLFGSLVKGTVGGVSRVMSFSTDLHWPTGFVVTRGRGSVLAGKTGAFADEGHVLFYDGHGTCVHRHTLPAGHLPVDVVSVAGGDVLVSDIAGRIAKFSATGRLVAEWTDVFRGPSGHLAVNGSNEVLVTSATECCIHRYGVSTGERLATFSLQWPDIGLHTAPSVTAITVNSRDEIIVTASNLSSPCFFAADGRLLHGCSSAVHGVDNGRNLASVALPSAVCCDAFDNVLIADFLGNCVHLMSRSGLHLGRLLTKTHGVACPNFLTLDQDARLYIGQYGGDVLVFHYLSYVKHV